MVSFGCDVKDVNPLLLEKKRNITPQPIKLQFQN
jgi:hypothetical protein